MTANPQDTEDDEVEGKCTAICSIKINWLGIKLELKEPGKAQVAV